MTKLEEVMADPSVHGWCKKLIAEGLQRDIVDSIHDLELACLVLNDVFERRTESEVTK